MADTDTNSKDTRKALRDWIDTSGNPIASGDEAKATGFRYVHLPTAYRENAAFDPESDVPPSGATFEMANIAEPVKTMLAIFGGLTLTGNIVSTATNPKSKGDPDANPIPDVVARFEEMLNGQWSAGGGAGGVRYDKDKLALAIAQAKGETDPNPYLAKLNAGEKVKVKGKAEISYGAYAMRNTEVQRHYQKLTGTEAVALTDL
jgi:hypothetical protein